MKHFKLTANKKVNIWGVELFQIELTIDCKWGKKGDLGGWIEKESNINFESTDAGFVFGGEIWGDAVIRGGEIRGGEIWGGAVIRGGEIRGGVIRGGVIRGGVIWGGVIRGGEIRGGVIWGGVIWGGVIWGGVIRGGEWKESPIQIQGTKHYFNECKKGYLRIGCIEMSFSQWEKEFNNKGAENGYTEKQIKEYGLYIDLAIKLSKL